MKKLRSLLRWDLNYPKRTNLSSKITLSTTVLLSFRCLVLHGPNALTFHDINEANALKVAVGQYLAKTFRERVRVYQHLFWMGKFLGLPEVLEPDDEDENHLGLARPKMVLWFVCNLVLPQNGHITAKCSLPFHGKTRLQTNHSTF